MEREGEGKVRVRAGAMVRTARTEDAIVMAHAIPDVIISSFRSSTMPRKQPVRVTPDTAIVMPPVRIARFTESVTDRPRSRTLRRNSAKKNRE